MNAIITSSKKQGDRTLITARTASGKTSSTRAIDNTEAMHHETAKRLSFRMGWGESLIGGETKEGFAYIPTSNQATDIESAVKTLVGAASAFPAGEKDPIRLAAGIIDIAKAQRGDK
jgi:hypothetical protein